MSLSEVLNSFLQGNPPRNIRMAAARGSLPLPPGDLLVILTHLAGGADPEIAGEALKTIQAQPEIEVIAQVQAKNCNIRVLEYFSRSSDSHGVLEAIILNPATPAGIVEALACRVPEALMETILYNRVRILECPGILGQLKLNPGLTPGIERLVGEIELEFFSDKRKEYSVLVAEEDKRETEIDAAGETEIAPEREILPDDFILEGLPTDPDEREIALSERLSKMTVPQKVRFAMQGNREARAVLIRDTNKEVARSVLKSPKVSESEVQAFAAMRNIADEILRAIGENRQWTRNYTVIQNLVKNPKTPPMTAQHLINHLHSKDLVQLSRDRAVSEAVRRSAQRMVAQRNAKGGPS